ncbi:MAG: hypothetical protein K2G32_08975 [Oscillospiraceae bacterium]|nr:hypothetical protein [Oscillospiraceae bacterium]
MIEDDGNIVVEGEYEYEDNEVVKALRGLYSLEYVGLSYLNEHLFRYGDDLLAIAQSPAEKRQSVYFKDSDYDESQFYYAYMFKAYKPHGVFPPEGITAPTTPIQLSTHEYETGEAVPAGNHVECFELDGIRYVESLECGYFDFVIEDNWKIVVEGEFEHEDNKVVIALCNLYSLEYVGLSHIDEHLFRFGNDILAIAKSPAAKIQSVYFKDYDYDESQFYYARIYEPYDFN